MQSTQFTELLNQEVDNRVKAMVGARHPEVKGNCQVLYFVSHSLLVSYRYLSCTDAADSFSDAVAHAKKCEQNGDTSINLSAVVVSPAWNSYASIETNRWLTNFACVLNADINDYSTL
ncbi:MAG: hypothetical protein LIO91_03675 [Bacteroidales bacterium]|nr:hypothetical protein [Bacteroidales bacterium]